MRHGAWLNAVPERPAGDKSKQPRLSRREQLKAARKGSPRTRADDQDDGWEPQMPPLGAAGYLAGILWEVGPAMAAGMGAGPVTHAELRAWQQNTGVELAPWEARFLRRLSIEYLAESHKAEKANRPAPWQASADASDRAAVAKSLQQSLMELTNL